MVFFVVSVVCCVGCGVLCVCCVFRVLCGVCGVVCMLCVWGVRCVGCVGVYLNTYLAYAW